MVPILLSFYAEIRRGSPGYDLAPTPIPNCRPASRRTHLKRTPIELALFEELGYEIQWHKDDLGREVSYDRNYLFAHDRGFVETAEGVTEEVLTGANLMALNAWYRSGAPLTNHARQSLKRVMRQAVDYRLDGRPLKVREALSQWRNLGQTAGEV